MPASETPAFADPLAGATETPEHTGAFWMPFTANRQFKKTPRLLASAEGMYYRSTDGREILDGTGGLWCCNAGHARPRIVRAIQEQAATLDFAPTFQMGHPLPFVLAERLKEIAPDGLDHVFFTNSGSESVDTALKIALAYHRARGEGQRTRLIGREKGYHGVGFGGISVGGMVNNRKFFGTMLPGVDHLPHTYNRKEQAFTRGEPEWGAHLADELERAGPNRAELERALAACPADQLASMEWLVEHMPEADLASVASAFLLSLVDGAYRAGKSARPLAAWCWLRATRSGP